MVAGNIAPTAVISSTDLEVKVMSKEQMRKEMLYQTTMSMARQMMEKSLISKEEYVQIDTKMQEKYEPSLGTLFADIDLI